MAFRSTKPPLRKILPRAKPSGCIYSFSAWHLSCRGAKISAFTFYTPHRLCILHHSVYRLPSNILMSVLKILFSAVQHTFQNSPPSKMPNWKPHANTTPIIPLVLKDIRGNTIEARFFLTETPASLRFKWLHLALGYSREVSLERVDQLHISMIEQLGSLGNTILDFGDDSLGNIEDLQENDTLLILWHWSGDCDGMSSFYGKVNRKN